MALRKVKYFTYDENEKCEEIKSFIRQGGITLDIQDISREPLTENQIRRLLGHFNLAHFLNPMSPAYKKNNLDQSIPGREEIVKMISEDHTLLRRPIIKNTRLLTVGLDKKVIADMLQISENGDQVVMNDQEFNQPNSSRSHGRYGKNKSRDNHSYSSAKK
jgi:arsenate reductase-like glutaredoxin family protein